MKHLRQLIPLILFSFMVAGAASLSGNPGAANISFDPVPSIPSTALDPQNNPRTIYQPLSQ